MFSKMDTSAQNEKLQNGADTASNMTGNGSGVARKPNGEPTICPEALMAWAELPELGSIVVKVPAL